MLYISLYIYMYKYTHTRVYIYTHIYIWISTLRIHQTWLGNAATLEGGDHP